MVDVSIAQASVQLRLFNTVVPHMRFESLIGGNFNIGIYYKEFNVLDLRSVGYVFTMKNTVGSVHPELLRCVGKIRHNIFAGSFTRTYEV